MRRLGVLGIVLAMVLAVPAFGADEPVPATSSVAAPVDEPDQSCELDAVSGKPLHCNCSSDYLAEACPLFFTCISGRCQQRPGQPYDGVCRLDLEALEAAGLAISSEDDDRPAEPSP